MARKRKAKRPPKDGPVFRMTSEEATLAGKPRYNGFACGHGPHGKAGYDRNKMRREPLDEG